MMYLDASLRRKVTAPIRSSGTPILPVGISEIHLSRSSGFSSRILRVLVATNQHIVRARLFCKIAGNLQSSQHVSRANAVYPDTMSCPFDGKRRSEMANGCLGGVVGRLRLGYVDDGTRHATDHHNTPGRLALHQVLCHARSKQICAVHVHAPELLHTVVWVADGVEVFGKSRRRDEMVDLAVLCDDLGERVVNRVGV